MYVMGQMVPAVRLLDLFGTALCCASGCFFEHDLFRIRIQRIHTSQSLAHLKLRCPSSSLGTFPLFTSPVIHVVRKACSSTVPCNVSGSTQGSAAT